MLNKYNKLSFYITQTVSKTRIASKTSIAPERRSIKRALERIFSMNRESDSKKVIKEYHNPSTIKGVSTMILFEGRLSPTETYWLNNAMKNKARHAKARRSKAKHG